MSLYTHEREIYSSYPELLFFLRSRLEAQEKTLLNELLERERRASLFEEDTPEAYQNLIESLCIHSAFGKLSDRIVEVEDEITRVCRLCGAPTKESFDILQRWSNQYEMLVKTKTYSIPISNGDYVFAGKSEEGYFLQENKSIKKRMMD